MKVILCGIIFGCLAGFLIGQAHAADKPVGWRCVMVRNAVAVYGEAAALAWAKKHGWSDNRIAEAKRCLGSIN